MQELTFKQKFMAMDALGDASIRLNTQGYWYVSLPSVSRKEGGILSSGGNFGLTIEEAINKKWTWLICPDYYIVIEGCGSKRRAVRWNGFMWEDVLE